MQGESAIETGWQFVAASDSVATIIDTLLRLDTGEQFSRSELAEKTGIPLKTLHLMDDVDRVVELGLLEKHDEEGKEVYYTVNEDSEVLTKARAFDEAVARQTD